MNKKYNFDTRLDLARSILPKNSIGCEIGVGGGDFSLVLYKETNPLHLYLIDRWAVMKDLDPSVYGWKCKHSQKDYDDFYLETQNKFKHYNNVTIIRKSSQEALNQFSDHYFDYIYIDASHDYESVKKDLELAKNKIKSTGFICGHDYNKNYNKGKKQEYGVIKAVDEFVDKYSLYIDITNKDTKGKSYVIYK